MRQIQDLNIGHDFTFETSHKKFVPGFAPISAAGRLPKTCDDAKRLGNPEAEGYFPLDESSVVSLNVCCADEGCCCLRI